MSARKKTTQRATSLISSTLEKRLVAYVAAAGAAGLVIGINPQAQAKVVYTATNTTLNGSTSIDLNNDGIVDFTIGFHEIDKSIALFVAPGLTGNQMLEGKGGAMAGFFGVPVGAGEKFTSTSGGYGWGLFMAAAGSYSVTWFFGPWANATNRYLGFKFQINGQTHYGWARLTVPDYLHGAAVVLTGYAYETTPNVNIIEGHISGPEKASSLVPADLLTPVSQPASLGLLARGAEALSIWRRDELL